MAAKVYEYKILVVIGDGVLDQGQELLNKWAAQGWRLVQAVPFITSWNLILEREQRRTREGA